MMTCEDADTFTGKSFLCVPAIVSKTERRMKRVTSLYQRLVKRCKNIRRNVIKSDSGEFFQGGIMYSDLFMKEIMKFG